MGPVAETPRGRASLFRVLALAAPAAAALTLLACGGGNPTTRALAAERAAEQNTEVKFQDFAKCLREHGIEAEAQTHGIKVDAGSEAAMKAAEKSCARFRPPEQRGTNRMSAQEKVGIEERLQRFGKCMREHGVQLEVSAEGGDPHIEVHPGAGGADPESPAFRSAQQACSKLLPRGGPGGTEHPASAAPGS